MSNEHLGWPWMSLGGALVLFAVMLGTNAMRSQPTGCRWWDPVWLSWLLAPMLMVHMFEGYAYEVLGRTYLIADNVCNPLGYGADPNCPIPTAHFPLVNLAIAWVAVPLCALMARRNLIIGLSFYGLTIFNGILHVVTALLQGSPALPGVRRNIEDHSSSLSSPVSSKRMPEIASTGSL